MRLKLPAYGKKILLERRAGKHPHTISVIYGDDWYGAAQSCQAILCLKPAEYQPGIYDFRMVAGCEAHVYDELDGFAEHNVRETPPTFGKLFDLIAELAAADACVSVCWPGDWRRHQRGAGEIAQCMRWFNQPLHHYVWPRWWNDALEAKHAARESAWLAYMSAELAKLEPKRERGRTA